MEITTLDIIIRLVVAAALSAVIGYEREYRDKPAGMRTNMLVGIGTAVVTIASVQIALLDPDGNVDISRIAGQVLPGIGFLGAGTILHARGSVKGLTTAATIWAVAAIGIVSGLGMFPTAFIAAVLTLITLLILHGGRDEDAE